jgi:hypothetical protein
MAPDDIASSRAAAPDVDQAHPGRGKPGCLRATLAALPGARGLTRWLGAHRLRLTAVGLRCLIERCSGFFGNAGSFPSRRARLAKPVHSQDVFVGRGLGPAFRRAPSGA